MKIALAQVNPTVGDLQGNVDACQQAVQRAAAQGAQWVVLPEMVIPGCPPGDILFDPSFPPAVFAANADLARRVRDGPPVLAGSLYPSGLVRPGHPGLFNAALLLKDGEVTLAAAKRLLPVHDVFHEPRWFLPGSPSPLLELRGCKMGVLLSDDLWDEGHPIHPSAELKAAGADLLVCLAASPYRKGIMEERLAKARCAGLPLVFANLWGANDELIYDGRSFILDAIGELQSVLPAFEEALRVDNIDQSGSVDLPSMSIEEELFNALVVGVRDFARKNRLERAFLGLSGGVDSSLTAVIAARALGPERVTGIALPSRFTDPRSTDCARLLAKNLGMPFEVVELEGMHAAVEEGMGTLLGEGTGAENVQARLRALVLMGYVNRFGGFLLNTSNKTELTVGYSTLYGDMAGTLCPLADLTKPQVYAQARFVNMALGAPIPEFSVTRPPSAELKPGQVDPFDYDVLSPQLEELVQSGQSNPAMRAGEHKRRQMGIILKVSEKAYGSGRLMPVTRR